MSEMNNVVVEETQICRDLEKRGSIPDLAIMLSMCVSSHSGVRLDPFLIEDERVILTSTGSNYS